MRKATGSYRTFKIPSKTAVLAELQPRYKVAQKERMDLSCVVEVAEVECRGGGPVVF